jgi:hypothetical protein
MNYWSISSFFFARLNEHLFERSDKAWFLIVTSARPGNYPFQLAMLLRVPRGMVCPNCVRNLWQKAGSVPCSRRSFLCQTFSHSRRSSHVTLHIRRSCQTSATVCAVIGTGPEVQCPLGAAKSHREYPGTIKQQGKIRWRQVQKQGGLIRFPLPPHARDAAPGDIPPRPGNIPGRENKRHAVQVTRRPAIASWMVSWSPMATRGRWFLTDRSGREWY